MPAKSLRCFFCKTEFELGRRYACAECGGSLEVQYELDRETFVSTPGSGASGVWAYRAALPIKNSTEPISMGEGSTPLVQARRLGDRLAHAALYLKNETLNPTLAFKDRAMSVAVTKAMEFGLKRIVAASTGNTAVSVSAYAARAGMACRVYVPERTPPQKLALVRRFGAEIEEVAGDFGKAYARAYEEGVQEDAFNVTTTYLNPYVGEGYKTLAYELFKDLGTVPDWIVIPVGAGPCLAYCYQGFKELMDVGLTGTLPKMVAMQAQGCAPIARAYSEKQTEVCSWGTPDTIAGAVADPLTTYPRDGTRTLRVIRESGGCSLSASDQAIRNHVALLAESEGLCVEPAAALATVGVEMLADAGMLEPDQNVVAVLTGHGLKDL